MPENGHSFTLPPEAAEVVVGAVRSDSRDSETLDVPGYEVHGLAQRGDRTLVYEGHRTDDGLAVLLKTPSDPTAGSAHQLESEFLMLRRVTSARIIRPVAFESGGQRPVLITEDPQSEPLHEGSLSITDAVHVTVQLVEALHDLHSANIIHRNLTLPNVRLHAGTKNVTVLDLGLATVATSMPDRTVRFEGALGYVSPEQTGRLARPVDFRTDFYSLGVCLFALLAGRLPFTETEAGSLIRAHIGAPPPDLNRLDPRVPKSLAAVVERLLAKEPEHRYQSANEILTALGPHLEQPWTIAASSTPPRFSAAHRIYGREGQQRTLNRCFARAAAGGRQLVLISGEPGIGRTALISSLDRAVNDSDGWMARGKCDQAGGERPQVALHQAFRDLVRTRLIGGEKALQLWREDLTRRLGADVAQLIDWIPEIETIFPNAGPLLPLPSNAARLRFSRAIKALAESFTGDDAPLVLVIDDLQWADDSLVHLLEMLLSDASVRRMLVVVAFRAEDVDEDHPIHLAEAELVASGVDVERIELEGLNGESIQRMLDEIGLVIDGPGSGVEALLRHTNGNPLFVQETLRSLYESDLIQYNAEAANWVLRSADLQAALSVPGSVADLLVARLRRLDSSSLLSMAACIGARFDLASLSVITGRSSESLAQVLLPAVESGVLMPIGDGFAHAVLGRDVAASLRFVHDQIQRAAYDLIDPTDRRRVRAELATSLDEHFAATEANGRIFEIAEHYNAGLEVLTPPQCFRAAVVNHLAAIEARKSGAHGAALRHARAGLAAVESGRDRGGEANLSPQDGVLFELRFERCHALSLTEAPWDDIVTACGEMLESADEGLQTLRAKTLYVRIASPRGRHETAVATGLEVLKALGVDIESRGLHFAAREAWKALLVATDGRDLLELAESLPTTEVPEQVILGELVSGMGSSLWATRFDLLVPIGLKFALNVIENGVTGTSPHGLALGGYVAAHVFHDFDRGYAFGQAALRLIERLGSVNGGDRHLVTIYLEWFRRPIEELVAIDAKAFLEARAAGNLIVAGHAASAIPTFLWRANVPLAELIDALVPYEAFLLDSGHYYAEALDDIRQAALNLLGDGAEGPTLSSAEHNENEVLARLQALPNPQGVHHHLLMRAELAVIYGAYEQALDFLDQAAGYETPGEFEIYDQRYYRALCTALTTNEPSSTLRESAQDLADLAKNIVPANFANRSALLSAELARVEGRHEDAESGYAEAIRLSREFGLHRDEGLAAELAARFYGAHRRDQDTHASLATAHAAYEAWGARAKVLRLEAVVPSLVGRPRPTEGAADWAFERAALGAEELFSALQGLSAELDPNKVFARLLEITEQRFGARSGCIVQPENGEWRPAGGVEADLPQSMIRYVRRTGESVFVDDAANDSLFGADPYFVGRDCLSVAAVPMMAHEGLIAVMILESDRAGAFATSRQTIISALASQAAIAVHNARALEASQGLAHRLGTVLDTVGEGVVTIDSEQTILSVNGEVARIFGYSKEELVGQPLTLIVPRSHGVSFLVGEGSSPGASRYVEVNGLRRGGEPFPVELRFSETEVDGRNIVVGVLRDITERVRDRDEVRRLSHALEQERDYLREEVRESGQFGEFTGESAVLKMVLAQIDAVAKTDATVLIHGESGAGKELLARAVHDRSERCEAPLVKVNCASIPKDHFERTLFGRSGSEDQGVAPLGDGLFALASGGTLFIDEIAEVPLQLQGKLLQMLERQQVDQDEESGRAYNVRVVAATNRDLLAEVQRGRFREDLYHRLGVFPVRAPSLRERVDDIVPLADHFLRRAASKLNVAPATLTPSAERAMRAYRWPGNIRELQNVMERASILARGQPVEPEMLGLAGTSRAARAPAKPSGGAEASKVASAIKEAIAKPPTSRRALAKSLSKQDIAAALERHDGVILQVAKEFGISRQALYRRMEKLGLRTDQAS